MGSKKNKSLPTKPEPKIKLDASTGLIFDKAVFCIALLVIFCLISYWPAFGADFVNWDDQDYASNNKLIQSFSDFSKFFTTPVQGNYHPLTMISLALNYSISELNPFSYHLVNVLLHILNSVLVFYFIKKLEFNQFIAFTVALLFAVHPMHVESVAWVTERKDVLYTAFFIPGLIYYLNYIHSDNKKYLGIGFLFFLGSIMSKPAAIIFPAVLFLLDFYKERKWGVGLILEKIPFALVSAFLLYLTMHAQTSAGATPTSEFFGWDKRIFFPFYGYMMYLYKLVWPMNLTAFYPLPPINEALNKAYIIAPLIFLATAYWFVKTWKTEKVVGFGFGFYLINLAMVLQLFLVGSAIIAERYTYMPYIGPFLIISWYLNKRLLASPLKAYSLVCGLGLVLSVLSFRHSQSWTNTAALWDNAIKSYPGAKAYTNRAYVYQQNGQFDQAIEHYTKSLKYNVIDAEVYYNMAVIYFNQTRDSLSLEYYNKALQYREKYPDAYNGRGSVFARMNRHDLAFQDFERCLAINPEYALAYKNKASSYFLQNQYDSAIINFKRYVAIQKNDAEAYSNICVSYLNKGSNEEAIKACEEAISMDPKFAKAYTNMGAAYINLNQFDKALEYLNQSFKLDSLNDENLKFLSLAYLRNGDTTKAYSIFEYAQRMKSGQ